MKLFQFAFITTLAGAALGAPEDEVACVFNKFRKQANIVPLKIFIKLMQSANQIVTASRNTGKTLLVVLGDKNLRDRYKRFKYEFSDAHALGGYNHKYPRTFAEAMVQKYPSVIRNPELKHLGYGKSNAFSNLDLGDSYDDNEPTKDAIGC